MSSQNNAIGRKGEDIVARYLVRRGYTLRARNFRCAAGELDIICSKGTWLYIIEVKSRNVDMFGYPEEAVTGRKLERMKRCTELYLEQQKTGSSHAEIVFQVASLRMRGVRVFFRLFTYD